MKNKVFLTLADGSVWAGRGRLAAPTEGEVVFTTAGCGYPQTLSDPSYCGQMVVFIPSRRDIRSRHREA